MEETKVGVEDSHDKANVHYGVCIFAAAIRLSKVVDLEDELGAIL